MWLGCSEAVATVPMPVPALLTDLIFFSVTKKKFVPSNRAGL